MRRLGIVTVARSDYSIYKPILEFLRSDQTIDFGLIVSGTHLEERFGLTLTEIEQDKYPVWNKVPILEGRSDEQVDVALSMGRAIRGFAEAYNSSKPDILLVLGDRFEMFAAVSAAVPLNLPIAHIHGGELTYGAIDEVFRHAITKMSHLHFTATMQYADRIRQMGEEDWRVTVTGAPSLDNLALKSLKTEGELSSFFGIPFSRRPFLVTMHPTTRGGGESPDVECVELLSALENFTDQVIVFTAPNADAGGGKIREIINKFIDDRENCFFVENFGSNYYLSALKYSSVIIGNSSSAIIESPSLFVPAVNIGSRQDGRTRADNVIDVLAERNLISAAIDRAISSRFAKCLAGLRNPYGDGTASCKIVDVLKSVDLAGEFLVKKFIDRI